MSEKKGMADSEREVEARDREWLANTYMGGKEQEVTVRTLILGLFIGAILSLSNLYVGFKTGWGLGVTITAAIMAFAVFKAVRTILPFLFKRDLTILENNSLQTMAAACADTSSAGLVSAIPALMMVSGITLAPWKLMLWIMTILLLGIFMAIPMKRQMINVENLRFPTGTATAEVLKGIHETGGEAIKKARALFGAMGLGLAVAWCRDGVIGFPEFLHGHVVKSWGTWQWKKLMPSIPATFIPSSWSILSMPLSRLTLSFEGSLIMVGAGAIMGIRVGISLLFAAFLGYGVLGPVLIQRGDIEHPAPLIRAAEGFGPSAELYSRQELYFPVTVKAGQTLAFQVEEEGQSPRLLARTWQETTTYANRSDLENTLNAATLGDGTPNPFAGVVTFEVDTAKNHLLVKTAGSLSGTTTLSSSPATVHPALGFAPGSAGRALRFPFSVPAGTSLAFTTGRADGPRGQIVPRTISLTFENEARFEDERALLQALNGPTTPDGWRQPAARRRSLRHGKGTPDGGAGAREAVGREPGCDPGERRRAVRVRFRPVAAAELRRLPEHGPLVDVARRGHDGHRRTPVVLLSVEDHPEGSLGPDGDVRAEEGRGPGERRSSGARGSPRLVVRPGGSAGGGGCRRPSDFLFRDPLVDGDSRRHHVLLPRHRVLPGHGRDGHHARGRHGQDHAAHVRRRRAREHGHQPHDGQRDGRRGDLLGRPPAGPSVRLQRGRQPSQAVRGHDRRRRVRLRSSACPSTTFSYPTPA